MVIGFDGSRAFQKDRTGTENYSFQLLQALAKIDKKNKYIVYVCPNYSSILHHTVRERSYHKNYNILKEGSRPDKNRDSNNNNIWPENFKFKIINWPRLWTQGGLALQTFKDKLDVLFVPAHTLPVIKRPGLKTVVTVHDLGSEYLPKTHQLKQRLYLGFMQKFQLKNASKIIAVSKATKKDLISRLGIESEKVNVVYEGYDQEKFKVQSSKFKVNQNIKKYNLMYHNYFLFVGTVQPRKNLERLIRAYCQFSSRERSESRSSRLRSNNNSIKLVIAGQKGWMADEIYELPKKLGIEDKQSLRSGDLKVKFLGYVPEKDLPYFYSGAIALTFPSLFEGFGLPILEAQACGCPVLTSNLSSMPEVGGEGAVYVNPYNIDDIVKGMEKMENGKLRMEKVEQGFKNIKRFSWEKCAAQTLEVLESLR